MRSVVAFQSLLFLAHPSRLLQAIGPNDAVEAGHPHAIQRSEVQRLEDASAPQVLILTLTYTFATLFTVASLYSLPGSSRGGFWPIIITDVWSPQSSGHPLDPYSINHVNHGVIGFLLAHHFGLDMEKSLLLTILSAMVWELGENSDFVSDNMRHGTRDSQINAASDVVTCGLGFAGGLVASAWGGVWPGLAWVLATETAMGLVWRDNMVIKLGQFVAHSSEVAAWQCEGAPPEYWGEGDTLDNCAHRIQVNTTQVALKLLKRMIQLQNEAI